jgi:hypothetical protein
MRLIFLLFTFSAIWGIYGCSNYTTENQTGGASETINANIIIQDSSLFVKVDAKDTAFADISLIEVDYNPVKNLGYNKSAVVASGDMAIKFGAVSGKYNCIIKDRISARSLFVSGLSLGAGFGDTISDTLAECGSIQGDVPLRQIDGLNGSSVNVFLLGTFFQTQVDTSGMFKLNEIPAGSYSIIAIIENNEKSGNIPNRTVGREVQVKRGEILTGTTLLFSN